jgi:hypothetical protein
MRKSVANIDDDLDFISKTANYFLAFVNHKYGYNGGRAGLFARPTRHQTMDRCNRSQTCGRARRHQVDCDQMSSLASLIV